MGFIDSLKKGAKNYFKTYGKALAWTAAPLGMLGAHKAEAENKNMRNQVKQYNKNLESSSQKVEQLAASEGVSQQAAYQWASNQLRRHGDNPQALDTIAQAAGQRLEESSQRASQMRAAGIDMLTKRMAVPKKLSTVEKFSAGFETILAALPAALAVGGVLGAGINKEAIPGLAETQYKEQNYSNIFKQSLYERQRF